MIVILERSWTNKFGRKYPIGQKIACDRQLGTYLVENGYGKDTDGKVLSRMKIKGKVKSKK